MVESLTDWSAKNPYSSKITENYVLNGEGSRKETRHVVFDLGDSGLDYKVGDALGVIPENPQPLVDRIIELQNWNPEEIVNAGKGEKSLRESLKKDVEIHRANKKFIQSLKDKIISSGMNIQVKMTSRNRKSVDGELILHWSDDTGQEIELNRSIPSDDPASKSRYLYDNPDALEDYIWSRDYIDVIEEFDIRYTPEEFLTLADNLKPRLYSIASSHDAHPGFVELTVGIVRYHHHGRDRGGLATVYMADELAMTGKDVGIFMSPTKSFVLPEDPETDIIMVGPGTGIAPFRAFMEQRVHDKAPGKNWLIFGDQSEKTEFYYKETILNWLDNGELDYFTTAWSRDQEEKIYVQNRMAEHGEEIWKWIDNGAYFYVCGDKTYMAKDVHRTLIEIVETHGGMSKDDATTYVEKRMMKEEKRYLRDVY